MDSARMQKAGSKRFIAEAYESPVARNIFGDAFHPGGLELTARAVQIAEISRADLVLDVGCGQGTTVNFLIQQYGCHATGVDLSRELLSRRQDVPQGNSVSTRASFVQGDGEMLPFSNSTFDVIVSECSFSLLPNKKHAALEFNRVLKPRGRLVITDVILQGQISEDLRDKAGFACCVSGAKSLKEYIRLFEETGFTTYRVLDHSLELRRLTRNLVISTAATSFFAGPDHENSKLIWWRLLREAKPGYALIALIKR